ncbi:MAG TPA: hypothetical protein VMK84_03355 [Streptosporangiaceae bacterium]|nr:hypothetical protein [Streptosporangiaceae bacterium]
MTAAWPTEDQMTLDGIHARWGRYYDLWADGGTYYARHALAGEPLKADTPAGLDSAIRADWSRRGYAR